MIELLADDFVNYYRSEEAKQVLTFLDEKKKFFTMVFGEESIDSVKPEHLNDVFGMLSTAGWRQILEAVLNKYGFESVVEHVKYFLYGSEPLEIRFDTFFERLPEVPQLALMEVATFAQPKNFCIWDDAAKKTIIYIGHSRMHGLSETSFQETISGLDYVWARFALNHVRQILSAYVSRKIDYVDVHLFTRFVYDRFVLKKFVNV
ncbi:MAG: hypothetical protein QW463_01075 [Candidatus Caldarchaeum sp.]